MSARFGSTFVRISSACLLSSIALASAISEAANEETIALATGVEHLERAPVLVTPADAKKQQLLVYPAKTSDDASPMVLFLHGMCDSPENECPSLAGATRDRFLVCPRANLRCDGGGTIWSGDPKIRVNLAEDAIARAETAFGDKLAKRGRTLVGFSLGSFMAVDLAERQKGVWKNLILLGAKIEPDAAKLKEAGVESVLLGAGDRDMMKWHMVGVAARLKRQGIRAEFVGMGDVGHWFADDMDAWLAKAFVWLDQGSGA